jgi:signal recognition particle subunit SRP54
MPVLDGYAATREIRTREAGRAHGAALSVKTVTGKPIKFIGMGEKLSDLEPFFPDRMASRILGMGDVLSLIEKAQEAFDEKSALDMERKMRTQQFTLEDFLDQMQQIKKMGPLNKIMGMLPGVNADALKEIDSADSEKEMGRFEAIIRSMTKKERNDPSIINGSRRKRIAAGSGTTVQDVNKVLKSFEEMRKMMKMMADMGKHSKHGKKGFGNKFKLPFR